MRNKLFYDYLKMAFGYANIFCPPNPLSVHFGLLKPNEEEDTSNLSHEVIIENERKIVGYLIGQQLNLSSVDIDELLIELDDMGYIVLNQDNEIFLLTPKGLEYIKDIDVVLDTMVFYNYNSLVQIPGYNYMPSIYNMEDLISSKDNITKLDSRIKSTLPNKLKIISNHLIFAFEPHYYLIVEIFPNSKPGNFLYRNRYETVNPENIFNLFSMIIQNRENVSEEIKDFIVRKSQEARVFKSSNNEDVKKFASQCFENIGYKEKEDVKWEDFIPLVEDLVILQLNIYRNEFMLHTKEITKENFDPSRCELFIKTYAKYLSTLVQKDVKNPALNDNIDSLLMLYVKPGMKFMTDEKKWIQYIKDVDLGHYLMELDKNLMN